MERRRRRFLAAVGGAAALAGCVGGGSGTGDGETGTGTGTESGTDGTEAGGGDGQSLETHPAAAALDSQPRLGPPPGEAAGTIVAFEDPSCPLCRRFEKNTVPRIRRELVEPGDATFLFRGYPIRYDWGKPATHALEATYARDGDAHWQLASHYFDDQSDFREAGPEAVLSRTREFLAANTEVDAEAVVAAVENGDTEPAVQTDVDAGEAAGASATPAVFLFRDGQYRTKYTSSVGYDAIASALQL